MNVPTDSFPARARTGRQAAPNLDYDLPFIPIGMWTEAVDVALAESGTLLRVQ